MSGYYPDGVTGNEPQIAGGIAADRVVTCEQGTVTAIPTYSVTDTLAGLAHLHGRYRKALDRFGPPETATGPLAHKLQTLGLLTTQLEQAVKNLQHQLGTHQQDVDWECTFDGEEVDGEIIGHQFHWICPVCGLQQATDIHDDDDD